jgi:site-specific DNA-methyltransferase (adenine-specific)
MSQTDIWKNKLYFGDNLDVLRDKESFPDDFVDLIYLDPPFNSKATYNVLFAEKDGSRSSAQITAFEDTWHWGDESDELYKEILLRDDKLSKLIESLHSCLGENDMMAYLVMMAPRLVELKRVLKKTGSIYLHCDPTASHYLKLIMDSIFGLQSFLNEIIWHYRKWPSGSYTFQRNHDVILFYCKSQDRERTFNQLYMERAASTLKRFGKSKIVSGFDDSGKRLPSQKEDAESEGVRQDDVWDIGRVPPIKQLFPTQKPLALLEKIILASSNQGQIILDPFCGCGTSIVAAEHFKRNWIGIDITHIAISLIKSRLELGFQKELSDYRVFGVPVDIAGAEQLALQNRYQFEWWAVGLVGGIPARDKTKGADRGIDGYIKFYDDSTKKPKRIIIQVKSGNVGSQLIREFRGTMEREDAVIGAFITLKSPTKPMLDEARKAGFYEIQFGSNKISVKRIQILTITQLLNGERIKCPVTFPSQYNETERVNTGNMENQKELV